MRDAAGIGPVCDSLLESRDRLDGQNGLLQHCWDCMIVRPFHCVRNSLRKKWKAVFVEFTALALLQILFFCKMMKIPGSCKSIAEIFVGSLEICFCFIFVDHPL